jgi:hypothetical protein
MAESLAAGLIHRLYLWVGVGLAVLFSTLGVIISSILKRGPVVAWTMLNFLWGVGYGWLLPLLLRS